ncbi:hypothetical protein [Bacillus massilinigeriensis]|uniref:hypothetical protein n=1 Tax=Bacillus mediterraneensis TaxID=1805474 RepID=UPI0008F88E88|nr:hypothetical protein [Bacillus mediterraneensis]
MSLPKKVVVFTLMLGLFLSSLSVASAATVRNGKISYYDGVGRVGSDGKVLTKWDCAVGSNYRYTITKGTPIYTTNLSNMKSATLYKWDHGNFWDPIILDVQRETYVTNLGGSTSAGYITNGKISY